MKKIWFLVLILIIALLNSCTDNSTDTAEPSLKCTITAPADSTTLTQGDSLILSISAISTDNAKLEVIMLVDSDTLAVSNKAHSQFVWQSKQINPGDFYHDSGEPFVDWKRFEFDKNGNMSYSANGERDKFSGIAIFDTMFFKNTFPGKKMKDFMQEVHIGSQTIKTTYSIDGNEYRVTYPLEPYFDLPSSYSSSLQTDLRFNQEYDKTNGYFDEYEAYCRPTKPTEISQIGQFVETSTSIKFVGSYTVYEVPQPYADIWQQTANQLTFNNLSTWKDKNNNGKFDRAGGILDLSGPHKFKVIAKDSHGLSSVDSITVFINLPPGKQLQR